MRRKKYISYLLIALVLFLICGVGLLSYIVFKDKDSATTTTSTTAQIQKVKIYFSKHSESDNDPALTFPVVRQVTGGNIIEYALEQLLAGPNVQEENAGYFLGTIKIFGQSICDGDFDLQLEDRTATLKFCRTVTLGGSVSDGQLQSSIEDTVLQFSQINKVIILNKKGNCLFDPSGLNLCKE